MKKFLVILAILAMAVPALGTAVWDGTGNWTDTTGLWTGTAPGTPDPPPTSGGVHVRSGKLTFSSGTFSGTTLTMSADGHADDETHEPADAEFALTGGTVTMSGAANLIGQNNSHNTVTLSGSADLNINGTDYKMSYYCAGSLWRSSPAHAQYYDVDSTITMSGTSTLDVAGVFNFGSRYDTPGSSNVYTINMNGGTLTMDSLHMRAIGTAGRTLNLNGGSFKIAGNNQSISSAVWITGIGGGGGVWGASVGGGDGLTYTGVNSGGYSIYTGMVPEPATMAVLALGAIVFVARRRRSC